MGVISEDMDEAAGPNLAEKIRRAAMGRPTLDVAQFQFIGLKEIAARYGSRWPERRERATRVARQFIAKRIAPVDVLIPGADGFLLVFGQSAGVLADIAAKRIATELNSFFLGSEDPDLQLEATRAEMNVEDLAQVCAAAPGGGVAPPGTARYGYQPMWDARRQAIIMSSIVMLDAGDGRRLGGWGFETGPNVVRQTALFDELALKASEETLSRLAGDGRKALIGVNMHVSTLTGSGLMRIASLLGGLDANLARYRVVRIAGIVPGFPRIYLEDIARTLRRHVANIAFSIHWSEPDIQSVLRLQPGLIGFSVTPQAFGAAQARADLLARVRQAAEAAHQQQASFFVEGDLPADLCQRLIPSGADRLSSPLIWPIAGEPALAGRWPAARLSEAATITAA